MDYKNFLFRGLVSLIFIFIYLLIYTTNANYLLIFVALIYLLVSIEIINHFKKKIISITYIFSSFLIFCLYFFLYFDFIVFNLFLLTIVCFDIFSYLFGSKFGKNKILPNISPNKTKEGLIFGIIFSNIFSILYAIEFYELNLFTILLINFLILFSFIGDIVESYLKRLSNIKNSSSYLPGHGGFFDRFDSFILSIYILLLFGLIK